MLDKIDDVVELVFKARKDKKTLVLSIGCLIAFGVAVGAVAVYESLMQELDEGHSYKPTHSPYHDEDDEEDY